MLGSMLNRDYNHPCVIAVMLFNETWGIDHNGQKASDGMTTNEWDSASVLQGKGTQSASVGRGYERQQRPYPADRSQHLPYVSEGVSELQRYRGRTERNTYPGSDQ